MHVTLLALGSYGDVLPYAALGGGLRAAGHRVRLVTFQSFQEVAAAYDLDFYSIQGDARSLVASAGADMLALMRSFGSLASGYARDLSDPRLGETDLLINQLPAGLFGYDLAEKFDLPLMLASVIPLAPSSTVPLIGFPRLPLPGYNRLTYWIGEQLAWGMFRRVINRWRTESLGLAPLSFSGYASRPAAQSTPILNGFSRYIVDRPKDWGAHIHITGYWFPQEAVWQPPAGLLDFLEAGSPPVFFGFGSMPVKDPARTTATLLRALEQSGQRGILHAGWAGLRARDLPQDVYPIEYAPYGWLFPRMGMVFHHGGSGTTGLGLRSGRPSCAVPFVFDQYYWGARIAALGVGPQPIPYKQLAVENLTKAIEIGLRGSRMQAKAARLGQQLQAENGIQRAVELIEKYGVGPSC